MMIAAPIGPIPSMSDRVVPEAATAVLIRFFDALQRRVESGDVVDEFGGDHHPMPGHLIVIHDAVE